MGQDIDLRLTACEKSIKKQKRFSLVMFGAFFLIVGTLITYYDILSQSSRSLNVTELVVVDSSGTERVRISGNLPDAIINGKRVPRGELAAGILLYDGAGQERSGYVTWEPSGNVGLTLDSRKRQSALFVADPVSGTVLQIWHNNDLIELRSDDDGSRLTAVNDGKVVLQEPPIVQLTEFACTQYQEALPKFTFQEVLTACRKRFTETACQECLQQKGTSE